MLPYAGTNGNQWQTTNNAQYNQRIFNAASFINGCPRHPLPPSLQHFGFNQQIAPQQVTVSNRGNNHHRVAAPGASPIIRPLMSTKTFCNNVNFIRSQMERMGFPNQQTQARHDLWTGRANPSTTSANGRWNGPGATGFGNGNRNHSGNVNTNIPTPGYNFQQQAPQPRSSEWKSSPRVWNFLNPKMKTESGSMKISVMSYNVLSQQLLEDHRYLYKDCPNEYLDWSARGPALVEQITHHRSDIICLQEIQEGHWKNFFQPRLKSYGYKGIFVKRSGSKPDGCAILYKGHKFALVESVPVNFLRNGLLDRDNVGLILLLRPRSRFYGGQVPKICVATTHLLFNPKRGDVKLAQLILFLAEIEKHSFIGPDVATEDTDPSSCDNSRDPNSSNEIKKHPYCPVILCGDFNLEPNSPIYDFITTGYLRYDEHTSPELSGQKEGRGGNGYSMSRQFLPTDLGINDHCQYIQHVLNRQRSQTPQTKLGNILNRMNSGQAWHDFQFKSVYSHHSSVELVTTHHNLASCTVDYIFHSSGETMIRCRTDKGDRNKRKRRESSINSTSSHDISSNPRRRKTLEHKTKESISRDNDKDIEQHQRQQPQSVQNYSEVHNSKHLITILSPSEEEQDGCSVQIDSHLEKEIGKNIVERERPAEKDQNSAKAYCYKKVSSLEVVSHWSLLSSKEMERYNCLPNHIFPSDHTCLIGEFVLH